MALKTIIVDGLPVETTDAGEAAVNKLRGMLDAATTAFDRQVDEYVTTLTAKDAEIATLNTAHVAAIAAKDVELGTRDAKISELEKQVVTGPALDAIVVERAELTARAKTVAPTLDTAGKSNAEIKRAAVAAKLGDDKVKDKSDDYVGALFDHLATAPQTDPLRDHIRSTVPVGDAAVEADKAWKQAGDDLNAWRRPKAAA